VEADSKKGGRGMLERVPCWDASATDLARLHAFEEISGERPAGSGVASLDRAREERVRQGREGKYHKTGTEPLV